MIKVVGVPEHFNMPWHLAIASGAFTEVGLDLRWQDVPEGTGKMCQMLRDGTADVAIVLTEGIVRDCAHGNNAKIIQEYVTSPLLWGVHVDFNTTFQSISELQNKKVAISRFGSGSHLMAVVHAESLGWNVANLEFIEVNTLDGAIEALAKGKADYFMWEKFTTQPLVDQGVFRRIGTCPTPWPCFLIAARIQTINNNGAELLKMLAVINSYTAVFKTKVNICTEIANRYGQKIPDVAQWLSVTQWGQQLPNENTIFEVQKKLLALNLIDKINTFASLVQSV